MIHTTYIERDGVGVPVTVEYNFIRPRAATLEEPAEGGVEIESIKCEVPLTQFERDGAEQDAIDQAWYAYQHRNDREEV